MIHKYKKSVRDLAALRAHLLANGFSECSVASHGGEVLVTHGGSKDPAALVNSFVNSDYLEVTSTLPKGTHPVTPSFVMTAGTVAKFTIMKRSGLDGSVKADSSTAHVSWHGIPVPVSPSDITFNGPVEVSVGPAPKTVSGGRLYVDGAAGELEHVYIEIR